MKYSIISAALAAITASSAAMADVKFWMVTPSNEAAIKALQQIATDFNAQTPGANVSIENRSIDQHKASLRIAATSGQSPDIYVSWAV